MHFVGSLATVGTLVSLRAVRDPRTQHRGDVLNQGAAEENVQRLDPVADGEHGLSCYKRLLKQSEIGSLACGVGALRGWMPVCAIVCGVDVRGTARQKNGIEIRGFILQTIFARG